MLMLGHFSSENWSMLTYAKPICCFIMVMIGCIVKLFSCRDDAVSASAPAMVSQLAFPVCCCLVDFLCYDNGLRCLATSLLHACCYGLQKTAVFSLRRVNMHVLCDRFFEVGVDHARLNHFHCLSQWLPIRTKVLQLIPSTANFDPWYTGAQTRKVILPPIESKY